MAPDILKLIIGELGPLGVVIALFLYLYINERKSAETRERRLVEALERLASKYEVALVNNSKVLTSIETLIDERLRRVG